MKRPTSPSGKGKPRKPTAKPPRTPAKGRSGTAVQPAPDKQSQRGVAEGGAKARAKKAAAKAPKAQPSITTTAASKKLARAAAAKRTGKSAAAQGAGTKARPRLRVAGPPKRMVRPKNARVGMGVALARFAVGDVVRHKYYPFRGVIFDIDPVFANSEEWWLAIPEQMRPKKDQPFYHLLAENAETEYIAYVSEQNLLPDTTGAPVRHPQVAEYFVEEEDGRYRPVFMSMLN